MVQNDGAGHGAIRLGYVGGAHLHVGGLLAAGLASPTANVVGMVIEDAELRDAMQAQHEDVPVFLTAEELYAAAEPQAIVTCATNRQAPGIVAAAAQRGIHVMKEKPMASTLALAGQMAATAARHGVRLMVNWPTAWWPAWHHARTLVDAGAIGAVWQVHHRLGHGGPPAGFDAGGPVGRVGWGWLVDREENGGGAAVDFCSYGALLSRWIMGMPAAVTGVGGRYVKDFFTVEDNGVMILHYARGHSIAEGTWSQPAVPVDIPAMIYGENGAIALTSPTELAIKRVGDDAAETIVAPELPEHARNGIDAFTAALLRDEPFPDLVSAALARDTQEIVEAGLESMRTGQRVGLPLPAFLA
ncbi:MAG TPA: Gfo/Idh/MocA family oxidoreductase [Thermomicrobiales bacterium]|nr:Gfo/Idh/MocA family oxidoreductase [Thermomicrobiales bacterium]